MARRCCLEGLFGIECLRHMICLLECQSQFNSCATVHFAIAEPHLTQLLPVVSTLFDREPRSCHGVDTLQSQTRPEVVQADSLYGSTHDERLQVVDVELENVSPIKWHASRR